MPVDNKHGVETDLGQEWNEEKEKEYYERIMEYPSHFLKDIPKLLDKVLDIEEHKLMRVSADYRKAVGAMDGGGFKKSFMKVLNLEQEVKILVRKRKIAKIVIEIRGL